MKELCLFLLGLSCLWLCQPIWCAEKKSSIKSLLQFPTIKKVDVSVGEDKDFYIQI
jgi:hypothetical protein